MAKKQPKPRKRIGTYLRKVDGKKRRKRVKGHMRKRPN